GIGSRPNQQRIKCGIRARERRVGTRRTEVVEDARSGQGCAIENSERPRAATQKAKSAREARRRIEGAAVAGSYRGKGNRHEHGRRAAGGKTGSEAIGEVVGHELRVGGIDVNGTIEVDTTSELIAHAHFPGVGDLALDREIGLLCVSVLEVFTDWKS